MPEINPSIGFSHVQYHFFLSTFFLIGYLRLSPDLFERMKNSSYSILSSSDKGGGRKCGCKMYGTSEFNAYCDGSFT